MFLFPAYPEIKSWVWMPYPQIKTQPWWKNGVVFELQYSGVLFSKDNLIAIAGSNR